MQCSVALGWGMYLNGTVHAYQCYSSILLCYFVII